MPARIGDGRGQGRAGHFNRPRPHAADDELPGRQTEAGGSGRRGDRKRGLARERAFQQRGQILQPRHRQPQIARWDGGVRSEIQRPARAEAFPGDALNGESRAAARPLPGAQRQGHRSIQKPALGVQPASDDARRGGAWWGGARRGSNQWEGGGNMHIEAAGPDAPRGGVPAQVSGDGKRLRRTGGLAPHLDRAGKAWRQHGQPGQGQGPVQIQLCPVEPASGGSGEVRAAHRKAGQADIPARHGGREVDGPGLADQRR